MPMTGSVDGRGINQYLARKTICARNLEASAGYSSTI